MGRGRQLSPSTTPPPASVEADFDGLDVQGIGIGRTDRGAPVRARGALPDERARVRVEHVGRDGTHYGVVQDVLRASPDRAPPACPHYLRCGGCDLLHASLPAQRRFKRQRVADALGLELDRVAETLASPRDRGYRTFAKLVLGPGGVLGSYRPRSHDVQDMSGCLVHAPEAERVVDAARAHLSTVPPPGDLRYVLVRASIAAGRAVVTLVARRADAPGVSALGEALAARPDVAKVALHINATEGDALWDPYGQTVTLHDAGPVEERVGPVRQSLEAGAFAQVNPGGAAALYAHVVAAADPEGLDVLDLYSGSGGVGLALLEAGAARVLAVESVAAATEAACAAAASAGLTARFEARTGLVQEVLDGLDNPPDRAADTLVVLNPPRKGAGAPVMQAVLRGSPRRIVYVSCNPASLARDLQTLDPEAWRLGSVTPVDLFPHTRHVETVVVVERSGGA